MQTSHRFARSVCHLFEDDGFWSVLDLDGADEFFKDIGFQPSAMSLEIDNTVVNWKEPTKNHAGRWRFKQLNYNGTLTPTELHLEFTQRLARALDEGADWGILELELDTSETIYEDFDCAYTHLRQITRNGGSAHVVTYLDEDGTERYMIGMKVQ